MKKQIFIISLLVTAAVTIHAQGQSVKSSAADRLAMAIDEHGLDSALKMFAKLRENPGDYSFSELEFKGLGNKLLNVFLRTVKKI